MRHRFRRMVLPTAVFAVVLGGPAWAGDIAPSRSWDAVTAGRAVLVDVRTEVEWRETGTPPGALRIDVQQGNFVAAVLAAARAHPGREIHFLCRSGRRSGVAAELMRQAGFASVRDVSAGIVGTNGWKQAGLPLEPCGECRPFMP